MFSILASMPIRRLFVAYSPFHDFRDDVLDPAPGRVLVLGHRNLRGTETVGSDSRRLPLVVKHCRHRLAEAVGGHVLDAEVGTGFAPLLVEDVGVAPPAGRRREIVGLSPMNGSDRRAVLKPAADLASYSRISPPNRPP